MGTWVVVAVLLLGGAIALAPAVWSWLDPASPARAVERLLQVLNTWAGIRDLVAEVAVRGAEGEVLVRVLYLAPANVRLDVLGPDRLAGEVFTLRPVGEEWLFVHYRPAVNIGIETRITPHDLGTTLTLPTPIQLWDALRRGQTRVRYTPAPRNDAAEAVASDEFDISGVSGPFPRIVLRVDPATQLPQTVNLYADPAGPPAVAVEVRQLTVNTGLELRDVFRLEPPPDRWLAPVPPAVP